MQLSIEIDAGSGFCYGVIRAVEKAEMNLQENARLYSLGAIVHNNSELERLDRIGLTVINSGQMRQLSDTTVLIRAHGEPPATYRMARERNITLIDCTCPVVLKLQERIRKTYQNKEGKIVIFGKAGHAEVNGLIGQVNGDAVIVDILTSKDESGNKTVEYPGLDKIDFIRPISIFSQTTKDPREYDEICRIIRERICLGGGKPEQLKVYNTICKQVAQRHSNLADFARSKSVILFVSGKESSNGKVLYDLCKSVNTRSYHIQTTDQIEAGWFAEGDRVGICGATSTPKWQLEEVARSLMKDHL